MKMKDKLENAFKQALDNHELPYDASAWKAVQKQLPAAKTPWYWIGGAAAVVLIAGVAFFLTESIHTDVIKPAEKTSEKETEFISEMNAEISTNPAQQNELHISSDIESLGSGSNSIDTKNKRSSQSELNFNHHLEDNANNRTVALSSSNATVTSSSSDNLSTTQTWIENVNNAKISGLHNHYCANAKVILHAHNVPANTDVIWQLSDGSTIKGSKAEFTAKKDIKVRMKLVSSTDKNAQRITDWAVLNVLDAETPDVVVEMTKKNTKNYVVLSNTNPNVEHVVWRFENNICQAATCASYMTKRGAFNYNVESYDRNGCFSSTSGVVNVDTDYDLYVENTFTPNGDGINDVFMPEALKIRAVNFKMTIYDRNGKLLFETTDLSRPWDGNSNGQSLEEGVYVWVVSLTNEEGKSEQYRGVVNLKR
jgi:gliding motility-associated-like protein